MHSVSQIYIALKQILDWHPCRASPKYSMNLQKNDIVFDINPMQRAAEEVITIVQAIATLDLATLLLLMGLASEPRQGS